ncbi:acyltransferase family protein [Salinicoccus halodurans]|uniref:Peptidoglycan/LPS O-acetylase OafA/YrhL, contains acyltransferase and SGNH-hydrolase domains n=1 Tax=Salinicoccus halodurans TaxID=407035 RepID=A0A0F7HMM8_9STAP|nr:acyltransferase [Salinicoccus halodurans]AKG74182.1 hypothetical protein AAT16_08005 [Salinicoccus halodurans]SFK61629.1 Peptidoglycan/LPS O-acetylase OafA/YrhL, contains acyltransferase and SGNH-hydrolase domains [Salinicoccus halodurans]
MEKRNHNIDVLKAMAMFAVIFIHCVPRDLLYVTFAPYHIWQAVPVFMLLAGFNTANSYKKRNYESFAEFYNPSFIYKKVERLIYPFAAVWLGQVLLYFLFKGGTSVLELPLQFLTGGWGPGSYFVPIIVQATLILPLIYLLMKKNLNVMTFVLLIFSLLLEIVCLWLDVSRDLYRIIIVRYVFALTLGVWLAFNYNRISYRWILPLAGVSVIYITGVNYFELELIMEPVWLSQHAPAFFYTLLFTIVCLKAYRIKGVNPLSKSLIKVGRASYHIFLTQMVYFWMIPNMFAGLPLSLYVLISVVLCFAAGVLFFELENKVRKKLKSA